MTRNIYRREKDYHRTVAIELNNVANDLQNTQNYSIAQDLYKDAVKAINAFNTINLHPWSELSSLDSFQEIAHKIVRGKETVQSSRFASSGQFTEKHHRLDLYHWPQSICDHGPNWLLETIDMTPGTHECDDYHDDLTKKGEHIGAVILFNVGLVHVNKQEYHLAQKYLSMALDIIPQESEKCSVMLLVLAASHNNIGCIQTRNKMQNQALESFDCAYRCCDSYKSWCTEKIQHRPSCNVELCDKADIYMGTIASNLGRSYFSEKSDNEAMGFCQVALLSRKIAYGACHIDVMTTFYNMGLINHRQGQKEEALRCYQLFLDYVESPIHKNEASSEDIGTVLLNALLIQCEKLFFGTCTAQIENIVKKLQALRSDFGYDHPSIPQLMHEVGDLLSEQKHYNYAMLAFNEQLRADNAISALLSKK